MRRHPLVLHMSITTYITFEKKINEKNIVYINSIFVNILIKIEKSKNLSFQLNSAQ